jgi:hypothetical protein
MSIAERSSWTKRSLWTKRSFRIPAPSENVLLMIVAFAFLALHVLVATSVHGALPNKPVAQLEEAIVSYGD